MCLFVLVLALLPITSACEENGGGGASTATWVKPPDGSTLHGIVRLIVEVSNEQNVVDITYYYDAIDTEHLIGTVTNPSGTFHTVPWYTTEVQNGTHVLFTVLRTKDNESKQSSIMITVDNKTRKDAIPANAVKMTPENDTHPPRLNPDLPYLQELWEEPVPMPGPINTAGAEDSAFITPDGNNFYFWFKGDAAMSVYDEADDQTSGIYWSKKVNGEWTEPEKVLLNYYDEPSLEGAQTIHGNTMWFVSVRAENKRDIDIWTAQLQDGIWVNWENAGEPINIEYMVGELHVSADGNAIYYDSQRPGGKGGKDIWVTRKVNGEWQEPEHIDAVNSEYTDGWPFVTQDGTELWFTRAGAGAPEIFMSRNVNGEWQEPELIITSFAGESTMDNEGNIYFTHHAWDDVNNRVKEADFYVCYRKK